MSHGCTRMYTNKGAAVSRFAGCQHQVHLRASLHMRTCTGRSYERTCQWSCAVSLVLLVTSAQYGCAIEANGVPSGLVQLPGELCTQAVPVCERGAAVPLAVADSAANAAAAAQASRKSCGSCLASADCSAQAPRCSEASCGSARACCGGAPACCGCAISTTKRGWSTVAWPSACALSAAAASGAARPECAITGNSASSHGSKAAS